MPRGATPRAPNYLMLTLRVLVNWSGWRSNLPVLVSRRRPGPPPRRFRWLLDQSQAEL